MPFNLSKTINVNSTPGNLTAIKQRFNHARRCWKNAHAGYIQNIITKVYL
jgi:hypothetical protein